MNKLLNHISAENIRNSLISIAENFNKEVKRLRSVTSCRYCIYEGTLKDGRKFQIQINFELDNHDFMTINKEKGLKPYG